MKRLKNEKGVITMITLITVLFMVSFLISAYVVVANKVKTQKEILSETKTIYEPEYDMEETYNSYFSNDKVIPIYTVEQLLAIGNGEQFNIDGKIYTFSNNEEISYVLKNNLQFSAINLGLEDDWVPVNENEDFLGNFDWTGNTVEVITLNEITVIYDKTGPSTYKKSIEGLAETVTLLTYNELLQNTSKEIQHAASIGKIKAVLKETIDGIEKIAVIPTEYKISTVDGENSISEGLVIFDGTKEDRNNEFVWIPVTEKFQTPYVPRTGDLEPALITLYDTQSNLNTYYGKKEDGITNYYTLEKDFALDLHYNEMVSSVNKYNGFFIGRYETTKDDEGNIGSKYNTTVVTADKTLYTDKNGTVYPYRWWGLYESQRNSSIKKNGKYIQTSMIWGQQWDAMLKFLGDKQANSTISGTQTGPLKSGQAIYNGLKDIMNNIYDLRRNIREYTALHGEGSRMFRAGNYQQNYAASEYYGGNPTSITNDFRRNKNGTLYKINSNIFKLSIYFLYIDSFFIYEKNIITNKHKKY